MSIISKLKVWIGSDTENLQKGLKRSKQEVSGFAKITQRIGGMIAGAFAADAIVSFGNECRRLWGIQEKAEKKLGAVHKATQGASELSTDQLKRFASELQGLTTIGDEVTINAMAMMSTFKSIKGDVFKEATKAAMDMSAVMDSDLKSSILQIGKALESPEIGMSALREVGVSFTAEQIALTKNLIAEGKKQEAQLIILKELQNEFGGAAAAAADTATGAAEQLSNAWGDQKEIVGKLLTPSKELFKTLTDIVSTNNALLAEDSIGFWEKLAAALNLTTIAGRNDLANLKARALAIQQNKAANEDFIQTLELEYKTKSDLENLIVDLRHSERSKEIDWGIALDAIKVEIEKREQGIAALDKEEEKRKQIAKEQEEREKAHLARIAEVKIMEETSIKAVNDKIKAYNDLLNITSFYDFTSRAAYESELQRLNTLIAKEKERTAARYFAANPKMSAVAPALSMTGDLESESLSNSLDLEISGDASIKALELKMAMSELAIINNDVADSFINVSAITENALGGMTSGISEAVGAMIAGQGNMNGFATAVAGTFADMAISVGKTAIQVGVATLGIKAALKTLNPFAAIAAGAALVALGTAAKASLSNIANGGSGGTFSGGYENSVDVRTANTGTNTDYQQREINVKVSGKLESRGTTLVAVIDNETERKRLTT